MKNTKVTLAPLEAGDREQFILDNQESFKYGAVEEFGLRDDHFDEDGEIISRATMFRSSLNSIRQKQKNAAPPFPVRHKLCTFFHHFSFLPPLFVLTLTAPVVFEFPNEFLIFFRARVCQPLR